MLRLSPLLFIGILCHSFAQAQAPGEGRIIPERPPAPPLSRLALEAHSLSCFAADPLVLPVSPLQACPRGQGFRPLTNLHTPHAVFVTLQKNAVNDNSPFVLGLSRILESEGVELQVMATREEWTAAGFGGRANTFLVPSRRPVDFWAQDFMEFGVNGGDAHPAVLALQYRGRYAGNEAAQLVTDSCAEPIERLRARDWAAHSGNQGGNLEMFPGDLTVVGSSMDANMRESIERRGTDRLFVLDTSWLDVGHVDELVTVLPSTTSPCGFMLAYASPSRAFELMRQAPGLSIGAPVPRGLPTAAEPREPVTPQEVLWDEGFRQNVFIAAKIDREIARLKAELGRHSGCRDIPLLPLPTLFTGAQRAKALNPNPVNLLALGNLVIIPEQFHSGFERDIEASLSAHGVRTRWLDDRFYHFQGGGIHCATQALRGCTLGAFPAR